MKAKKIKPTREKSDRLQILYHFQESLQNHAELLPCHRTVEHDVRTVLNIENYKGNPKMEVLYPLIRALKIDAREIFNPEIRRETPELRQLRLLIEDCSEEEAAVIIPVFQALLNALRDKNATQIKME